MRLDSQARLALTVSGAGSVSSDVPGLQCTASCTTTWNAGQRLALTATPGTGAKLVRWTGACTGSGGCLVDVGTGATVSALFAPATFRLTVAVTGRGAVRSSRTGHHLPAALLGVVPVVHGGAADRDAGARLEAPRLERCLPRCEGDVHGADERRVERARDLRPALKVRRGRPRNDQVASFAVDAVHDVVVIGAGCAGMRAAIEAFDAGADVAMLSKIHPVRSHSGAAEGGINAALGNASEDDPEKHAFDTVKGSDYLGDQDAIEILCNEAPGRRLPARAAGARSSRARRTDGSPSARSAPPASRARRTPRTSPATSSSTCSTSR